MGFSNNVLGGISNSTPTVPVAAELNDWNSASGPSGQGPGTGQQVGSGVFFEPWLVAAPSQTQYFSSSALQDRNFNPSLEIYHTLEFASALPGDWSVVYKNTGGATVRTITGSGDSATVAWDGTADGGAELPNGDYTFDLNAQAVTGEWATVARGRATRDSNRPLAVTTLGAAPTPFSPNADGTIDTTTASGGFSFEGVSWQIAVKSPGGTTVRTVTGEGPSFTFTWDGKDGAGAVQPDGVYAFDVSATAGQASTTASVGVALDNTPPTTNLTEPSQAVLSNVYQAGATAVPVIGSATDPHFDSWTVRYGAGTAPSSWTQIGNATFAVSNGQLANWETKSLANGVYVLRLAAADTAGNSSVFTLERTVGNFSMTQSALEFNPGAGQLVSYVSTVPFELSQTLLVKDSSGALVRTLLPATTRPSGSYSDSWDGRDESSAVVRDGPYFYVTTVTDGTSSLTWDLTTTYWDNWSSIDDGVDVEPWDPFNNDPMEVSYNFPQAGRVSIALGQSGGNTGINGNCNHPQFCLLQSEYQESGPHTVTWAGVDSTGALRPDVKGVGVVTERKAFSKNAVVAFGMKPVVTNFRVTPPVFGPAIGTQLVEFDLTTFESLPVEVEVQYLNQESLSTLRTIVVEDIAPGHVEIEWDGRADNGMLVAPGYYTVTMSVIDPRLNVVQRQILTTIQY